MFLLEWLLFSLYILCKFMKATNSIATANAEAIQDMIILIFKKFWSKL